MSLSLIAALLISQNPPAVRLIQNNKKDYWDISARYFEFKEKTPLALFASKQLKAEATKAVAEFLRQSKDSLKEFGKPTGRFYHEMTPKLSVNSPSLISVYSVAATYSGGAHGMTFYVPHTYALINGKPREVHLSDLFMKGTDGRSTVSPLVIAKLKEMPNADWVQDGSMKELNEQQARLFVITPKGITFLFEPYSAGSYASGTFEIKLTFDQLKGKLDPNGPLKPLMK